MLFFSFRIANSLKVATSGSNVYVVDTLVFAVSQEKSKILFFPWSSYFHQGQDGAISWNIVLKQNIKRTKSNLGGFFSARHSVSLLSVNNTHFCI